MTIEIVALNRNGQRGKASELTIDWAYGNDDTEREVAAEAVNVCLGATVTGYSEQGDGAECDKALDGIDHIRQAVAIANGRIEIMAGSGVTAANALQLKTTGIDALHFSAKKMVMGAMQYRNPRISMGGTTAVDEFALRTVDEEEVKRILQQTRQ